jgi:pilus assembly protein CpaB
MGRRTLLLIAALLLAAIGTGVLFLFLRATTTSPSRSAGGSDTTPVVVPAAAVPAGQKIDKSVIFDTVRVSSAAARAAGMVTSVDQILGQVANQPLPALVPVTKGQFGGSVTESTDLLLPQGSMAITVELNDPNKVSTFLRKGSKVAIFVVDPQPLSGNAVHEARLVLPRVNVLTIGSSATIVTRPTATASPGTRATQIRSNPSLVTLQVNQEEAGKILVAQASGELYFTLLGPETTPTATSYDQSAITVP